MRRLLVGCASSVMGLGIVGPIVLLVVGAIGAGVLFGLYRYYVVSNPGPQIELAHIRTIIAQESPVYYRDGTTRVGVFFESEHRLYVPFAELPRAYVMGIVAAEDGKFWTHWGVNPKGIARAMRDNLLHGGMVAGGSTLTQQTAKNLYYRPDRSLKSKGIELLNALRLEAHYDKPQILEFYANQFHVSGNGRGLGIAARHFFDEDVDELSVLQCAFLAGLVKAPSYYDPFLGDQARRDKAIQRAHDRTRYVLGRMLEEPVEHLAGPVPDGTPGSQEAYDKRLAEAQKVREEAKRLLDEGFELPFRRGAFRYASSSILDEVARRLAEPPFDEVLGGVGIDDPTNAGLVVVTTLDADAQREATYSLWHHLTEVGTWMEALKPKDFVLEDSKGPRFDPDFPPTRHEFRVARVVEKSGEAGKKRQARPRRAPVPGRPQQRGPGGGRVVPRGEAVLVDQGVVGRGGRLGRPDPRTTPWCS
ncbi:MAG: transglycosylase domain-containing protein [Myxococcota bacterium]